MTEQEDKLFLRRLEEAIKRTDTRGEISASDFWDTHRQSIAQERLEKCGYAVFFLRRFCRGRKETLGALS